MNFDKIFFGIAVVLILTFGFTARSGASTGTDDFNAQAVSDFQKIADFVNAPFSNSLGFFTGLGWNTTPTVFDFVAGPHFEFGVGAGADLIGLPNLASLSLPAISAASNITLPSALPIPFPVLTGRLGLLSGLDIGFRYTNLPPIALAGVTAHYDGWGLAMRCKIFDGLQVPTVTLGMSYDTMNGTVAVATHVNQSTTYVDGGSTYNVAMSGLTTYGLNWTTQALGGKVEVGKSLGILYPFAAVGFQRNQGSVASSMTGALTETLTGGSSNGTATSNITAVSAGAPVVLEPKYVLGFDLGSGIGIHWAVVGESNGKDVAGSTSLRGQF